MKHLLYIVIFLTSLVGNLWADQVITQQTSQQWHKDKNKNVFVDIDISSIHDNKVFTPIVINLPYSINNDEIEIEINATVKKGDTTIAIEDSYGNIKKMKISATEDGYLKGFTKVKRGVFQGDPSTITIHLQPKKEYAEKIKMVVYPKYYKEAEALPSDKKTIQTYKEECQKNKGRSCTMLADLYFTGKGLKKDTKKAMSLFQKACDLKDGMGCSNLAWIYHMSTLVTKDMVKAIKLYKKACSLGSTKGCTNMGMTLMNGVGVEKDIEKSIHFYQKSCKKGDAVACRMLRKLEYKKKEEKEFNRYLKEHTKGCNENKTASCITIADMYFQGVGVEQDNTKAKQLFSKACKLGDGKACNNLGWVYKEEKKFKESKKFYTKACNNNYLMGCSNLGYMYEHGTEVKKDFDKAEELYSKACKENNEVACSNLKKLQKKRADKKKYKQEIVEEEKGCKEGDSSSCGSLALRYLEGGFGTEQNFTKAKELFEKSCNDNDLMGCSNLGLLYALGKGVKQDKKKAKKLLTKVCNEATSMLGCENLKYLNNNNQGTIHWMHKLK